MLISRILVHTDASPDSATAVKAAGIMAEKFNAHLTGFFIMPDIAAASAMPEDAIATPQLVDDMQKFGKEQASAAEAVFRDAAGDLAAPDGWIVADGMGIGSRAAAADVSHFADLIVTARADGEGDGQRVSTVTPQDLVVDSGRPVIVVPPSYNGEPFGRQIVVAWSNGREATRAVFDALPFLTQGHAVRIVTVADDASDDSPSGQILADRLTDYNVTLSVSADVVVSEPGKRTSEKLFEYAARCGADMLVAGAYSHSRLREGLFGGVTKTLIRETPVPTLLSH